VNAKNSSHAVCEFADTTSLVELLDGPFKADSKHHGVSCADIQSALWLDPELKYVLNTEIAILSTVSTLRLGPLLEIVIPVSWFNELSHDVIDDIVSSIGVRNGDQSSRIKLIGVESELLSLGWGASVLESVVASSIDEGRELLQTLLRSVSTVPTVVHVSIKTVVESSFFVNYIDWLGSSIPLVFVFRLENEHTKVVFCAHIGIPV